MTPDEAPMIRLSVNISGSADAAVRDLMTRKGVTATELVRLMISAYAALQEIQDDPAARLLVERDGKLNEIVFM